MIAKRSEKTCCRYRIALRKNILLAFCDGCYSLALPSSATDGGRARPQAEPHLDMKLFLV
ncbi:MAG: hypothetical protein IJY43_04170 [Clostridia bacterium]|nr:hypothetical protein [Clostridia bacterium]